MTSYSTLLETMCPCLYRFRVIASYSSKVAGFNLPHLRLVPPYGVFPFEVRRGLWYPKTRVAEHYLPFLKYHSVTNGQKDTHTERHMTTTYTALA